MNDNFMTRQRWLSLSLCALAMVSMTAGHAACSERANAIAQVTAGDGAGLPEPYGRHTDDLDGMLRRHTIRALVLINPIGFFYDNGQPMGINYEALRAFETFVNEKYRTRSIKVEVTFIPLRPDQVEAALNL